MHSEGRAVVGPARQGQGFQLGQGVAQVGVLAGDGHVEQGGGDGVGASQARRWSSRRAAG
jgi:hypothetical protein